MLICHFCSTTVDTHYFANLGRGFSSKGLTVLWGTLSQKKAPAWMENLEGAEYFCLDVPARRAFYPLAVSRLASLLRRRKVDILQTHLFDAGILGVMAARLAGTPLVIVTRHHLDQVHMVGNRFHVAMDRWMARKADKVVVLSNAVRNYMMTADGIDGSKVEVIYQGFDFEKLSATEEDRRRVRAELNLEDRFVIGCIGQLFETKGQSFLLKALSLVADQVPNGHLLFLGGGDPKPFEDLARELGLSDRVTFAGFRKDVPACMKAMDLVVHPSLSEAFCQVLIESMAAGKPLVTTDVGGAAEVVTQGETGILVPPADPESIARAIVEVYKSPQLKDKFERAGQESVRRRFPVSLMVDRQLSCYERWFNGSGSVTNLEVST
jgi:glycosyltransferase involved in cell wall biosynthesis